MGSDGGRGRETRSGTGHHGKNTLYMTRMRHNPGLFMNAELSTHIGKIACVVTTFIKL